MISRRQFMKISTGTVNVEHLGAKILALTLLKFSATIWLGEPK